MEDSIIDDAIDSIPFASSWEIKKVNRSANFYVHYMIYWTTTISHSDSIFFLLFPFLLGLLVGMTPPFFLFFVVRLVCNVLKKKKKDN